MDQGLIPRRYAKALYEVGAERKDNDRLYTLMQRLVEAYAMEPSLAGTLANPFVTDADKTSLLRDAVYGSNSMPSDDTYMDFIKLLEQNGRVDMARDIAYSFIDLYRKEHSIYRVVVASAAPMGEAEKKRLDAIISSHVGNGTLEYEYTVDPKLIGGFTVTINSERLDASISNELKRLRLSLIRNN